MKKIKRKMESMQTKQMQTVFELKNFSNEVKGNMIKIKPDYLEQIV
jgi:DNA-binding protein YbaB